MWCFNYLARFLLFHLLYTKCKTELLMTSYKTTSELYPEIIALINRNRLADAIAALQSECKKLNRDNLGAKLKDVTENYAYLRRYAVAGVADPSRSRQLARVREDLLSVADALARYYNLKNSSAEYYSTYRFEASRPEETIAELVSDMLAANTNSDELAIGERLFRRVWVSYPLHDESLAALRTVYANDKTSSEIRSLLVSAILLGVLQSFDLKRINFLLEIYLLSADTDAEVSVRAVTAAVIAILAYGRRIDESGLTKTLVEDCERVPSWKSDISNAYLCVVHTLDTPRINSKILNDLVPGIMKLKPKIEKEMPRIEDVSDLEDLEENPQWADMLEKSGLADKMRQMAEIQQEGGDVFMSTFSHLKNFPFFNSISNWFIPFTLSHPELNRFSSDGGIVRLLGFISDGARFLCNSDKYSLVLSLTSMPESQRNMLTSQISMANEARMEEINSELLPERIERNSLIKSYVQDLYRFFNLYSRKDEFENPFVKLLDLTSAPLLANRFEPESETINAAAAFCFAHKQYPLALCLFNYMLAGGVFSQDVFQKTGYCYQSLNDFRSALESYRKAELLDGDNIWTLKKIASCLAILGEHKEALSYYKRLFDISKEDVSAIRSYLMAAVTAKEKEIAVDLLKRLEYYSPSPKNYRIASMVNQISGDADAAYINMGKFISEGSRYARSEDYITHSILAIVTGNYAESLDSLSVARESEDWTHRDIDEFYEKFHCVADAVADRLGMSGKISKEMMALVFDSLPRI